MTSSQGRPVQQAGALCARCGYALKGLKPETPCPECGTVTPVPESVPERVQCVTCGYALEGLAFDGRCPECGVGVRWSMRGPLLEHRDPEYVRRLRRGAGWICISLLAVVVLVITLIAVLLVLPLVLGLSQRNMLSWAGDVAAAVVPLMLAASYLVHYWGWWLLASADPGMPFGDKARRVNRVNVQAGVVVSVLAIVVFVVGSLAGGTGSLSAAMGWLGFFLMILSLAAFVTVFISGLVYLKHLALRLPSRQVHRMAGFRVWFCPTLLAVGIGTYFLCIPMIAPIVALVLYYNLIARLRGELGVVEKRMKRAGSL